MLSGMCVYNILVSCSKISLNNMRVCYLKDAYAYRHTFILISLYRSCNCQKTTGLALRTRLPLDWPIETIGVQSCKHNLLRYCRSRSWGKKLSPDPQIYELKPLIFFVTTHHGFMATNLVFYEHLIYFGYGEQ